MSECVLVAQLIKFSNILHWHWMEFFVVKNIMLKKNNSNIILHGNQNEEIVDRVVIKSRGPGIFPGY